MISLGSSQQKDDIQRIKKRTWTEYKTVLKLDYIKFFFWSLF